MTPDQKVKRRQINEKIADALARLHDLEQRYCLACSECTFDEINMQELNLTIDKVQYELAILEDEQENFYRQILQKPKSRKKA